MKNITQSSENTDFNIVFLYDLKGVLDFDLLRENIFISLGDLHRYVSLMDITIDKLDIVVDGAIPENRVRIMIKNIKGALMESGAQNIKYRKYNIM